MKKLQIFCLTVLLTVVSSRVLRADTSYLLVEGPFGAASATQTFKWSLTAPTQTTLTGQDLLNAIFGFPLDTGTKDQSGSEVYKSGNATTGAGYISFGGGSLFLISLTLQGTTVLQDPSYSPGWSYYVAGGSGSNGSDFAGGSYADGQWTYSNDGGSNRMVKNGNFDGYLFGSTGTYDSSGTQLTPPATIVGASNSPTAANFTAATPVSVPEPGSCLLLGAAAAITMLRRHR